MASSAAETTAPDATSEGDVTVRVEFKYDADFVADNDVVLTTYELLRSKPTIFRKVQSVQTWEHLDVKERSVLRKRQAGDDSVVGRLCAASALHVLQVNFHGEVTSFGCKAFRRCYDSPLTPPSAGPLDEQVALRWHVCFRSFIFSSCFRRLKMISAVLSFLFFPDAPRRPQRKRKLLAFQAVGVCI